MYFNKMWAGDFSIYRLDIIGNSCPFLPYTLSIMWSSRTNCRVHILSSQDMVRKKSYFMRAFLCTTFNFLYFLINSLSIFIQDCLQLPLLFMGTAPLICILILLFNVSKIDWVTKKNLFRHHEIWLIERKLAFNIS